MSQTLSSTLQDGTAPALRLTGLKLIRQRPGFAWLVGGMAISAIGDPMTTVAGLVTMYAATRSPLAVAAVYAVRGVASIAATFALGASTDRFSRRDLVVRLDLTRGAILVVTPLLVRLTPWSILFILFVLGVINAIVQPTRQAATGVLVKAGEVGPAYASLTMILFTCSFIGYPTAGAILFASHNMTAPLFWIDAITFLVAALLALRLGPLGGGQGPQMKLHSATATVLGLSELRPHLVVAVLGSILISMTFGTLLLLGYLITPNAGPQAYTILEAALTLGVAAGSWIVGRFAKIGSPGTVALGLLIMGLMIIGVSLAPTLMIAALFMLFSSLGNPIYLVGNQTLMLESSSPEMHGRVMAVRYGTTQICGVLGALIASALNSISNPRVTYLVLSCGLVILGLVLASQHLAVTTRRRAATR